MDVEIGIIPDMKEWFNTGISINVIHYTVRLREEKTHDHLNRYNKAFNKIKYQFLILKRL